MRNIDWRIGCSGFHYSDWKEIFYPKGLPQRKWFDYYCAHFNTLELNVTFYRFPQPKFLENWYNLSPAGFDFSVKAPRLITHYKQFSDTQRMLNDFYTTTREGLRDKLGCILFQFPARMAYSDKMLERILGQLDTSLVNMLEFRHASWWIPQVYERLAAYKVGFCGHSYPLLPDDVVCNNPVLYYRFHGLPKLYYSQYKRAFVQQVAWRVRACEGVQKAYVYFNNTATIAAIRNARYLQQLTREAG
ncbi:MAG TPA: DUF72 domain-containing protein [Chitinophagaceae bacterium]|nr:DUF72 domain-containing protein [Chitinophagaceae bacterium]